MKNQIVKLLAVLCLILGISPVSAQTPTSFDLTKSSDIGVVAYLGYMPRESPTNLALQGPDWTAAATNWVTILRTGGITQGSGHAMAAKQPRMDYDWMVTSTYQSWHKALTTDGDHGNRTHWGFRANSLKPTVKFRICDVWCKVESYTYSPSQGWHLDGVIHIETDLTVLNYFRLRLEAGPDGVNGNNDDIVSGLQDSAVPSENCLYGGLGTGIGSFGSGNDQQKLDNVVAYCRTNNMVLRLVMNIPYLDGTTPKEETWSMCSVPSTFVASPNLPDGKTVPPVAFNGSNEVTFGIMTDAPEPNGLYVVEKSPDLIHWSDLRPPDIGDNGILHIKVADQTAGAPHYFYRGRYLIPALPTGAAARSAPPEKPTKDDSIAP